MPRVLRYTDRALADLAAISRWLTQSGSGVAAQRRLASVWADIEGLREHPCRFPIGHHEGVRELPCGGGYRALYEVAPDTGREETAGDVTVLRVFGPGQSRLRL